MPEGILQQFPPLTQKILPDLDTGQGWACSDRQAFGSGSSEITKVRHHPAFRSCESGESKKGTRRLWE